VNNFEQMMLIKKHISIEAKGMINPVKELTNVFLLKVVKRFEIIKAGKEMLQTSLERSFDEFSSNQPLLDKMYPIIIIKIIHKILCIEFSITIILSFLST